VLCGGPAPVTCVARTEVHGWFFERAALEQLRRETSPGAFAFIDQIARAGLRVLRDVLERRWGSVAPTEPAAWEEARLLGPAAGFLEQLGLPEASRLRAQLWQFPADMIVVQAGEVGRRFLIVTHGRVAVITPDGTALTEAGRGDMPGVLAILDGGRQPYSFLTREPTIAAVIDADRFRELRYGDGPLAADLVPRIHGYLVERYRPLLELTFGDDEETLVDALIF